MKLAIVNGSPKGDNSITIQGAHYLARKFPENELSIVTLGPNPKRLEDPAALAEVVATLAGADALLWFFPVYFNCVPSQLKRFVELLFAAAPQALAGKYATSVSTSANFYDHLAHGYMQAVSEDLGLRYIQGLSFGESYLLTGPAQEALSGFARFFFEHVTARIAVERASDPLVWPKLEYRPALPPAPQKKAGPKITLVTDARPQDGNLNAMIESFCRSASGPVEVLNLHEVDLKGGCLGCLRCSDEGHCAYNDGFERFFREKVLGAEVLVWAGRVQDRYLSSRWKAYFDRSFFNGHRPAMNHKPVGLIISGPWRQLPHLRQVFESMLEVGHAQLVGVVSDEYEDAQALTDRLAGLARQLEMRARDQWVRPNSFLGIGGHKVFRDLIYGHWPHMRADHQHYRAHGLYDYPQKKLGQRLVNLLFWLLFKMPGVRKRSQAEMMARPYRRAVAALAP